MDNNEIQLVGGPCGQHGPYTFYKAFRYAKNGVKRIVTLSEFFFVKLWINSDLLCIGELQLLWSDKNSDQVLASLRLYFLPENTPDGRMDHGEDEVLAISEKVVLRVEDLITWITVDAEWTWGRLAKCESDVKDPPKTEDCRILISSLTESSLDFSDVEKERKASDCMTEKKGPLVLILSYPRYCRYRAMMRRLEGVEDEYLKYKVVKALGGLMAYTRNTRVLFCKETFDYPELETHEMLCNHLAPKLKGRPRGKRKKRSVSPGSESNESESSVSNVFSTSKEKVPTDDSGPNGLRCDTSKLRRSTRSSENNEGKAFMKELSVFMKTNYTPIGRIPSLGFKELDLFLFYTKVSKMGGYESVTTNRLWKSIFDDMVGHHNSTSAATVVRRHYERFLLPYERHVKGEEYKPLPVYERRRLKSKAGSSASDAETSESASRSGNSTPVPQATTTTTLVSPSAEAPTTPTDNKEYNIQTKLEGKTSSLRSVRVKTERQKDKLSSDKCTLQRNSSSSSSNDASPLSHVKEDVKESEEMTVEETATESTPTAEVEEEVVKEQVKEKEVNEEAVNEEEVEEEEVEDEEVEDEEVEEKDISEKVKSDSVVAAASVPEKDIEPLTSAVAPVAPVAQTPETYEKDIAPVIQTGDTPSTNTETLEAIEVPYKPPSPPPSPVIHLEAEDPAEKAAQAGTTNLDQHHQQPQTYIHEVKKRKLDILKEGGLEVTPVRALSTPRDARPSVIQQVKQLPSMPPPSFPAVPPKRLHISVPQATSLAQLPAHSSNYVLSSLNITAPTQFVNSSAAAPPRVVQSRSIYTYSEKTVYGDPKDYYNMMPPAVPKLAAPRQFGGDILDLTVTSPQKPAVEIMRVPHYPPNPFNLYKSTIPAAPTPSSTPALLDGRRLGPNTEITLVSPGHGARDAPRKSSYPPQQVYPQIQHQQKYHHKRSAAEQYAFQNQKVPRLDETRVNKSIPSVPLMSSREAKSRPSEISIPHPYANRIPTSNSAPLHASYPKPAPPQMPVVPTPKTQNFPTPSPLSYLSHLYEGNKGISAFLPYMDPVYYTAAMQNLYGHTAINHTPPVLPFPNPDHLKLYSDIMAQSSRINFPFQVPVTGSPPVVNNNNNHFKKS